MSDLIDRQAAIDTIRKHEIDLPIYTPREADVLWNDAIDACCDAVEALPSVQPEIKPIGYQECANAMLKMWIDNVVTDGEYNRIMDKLNSYWRKNDG